MTFFKEKILNPYVRIAAEAAYAGVLAAQSKRTRYGRLKDDQNVGHHSVVTESDLAAERAIQECVIQRDPNAFFITEEGGCDRYKNNIFKNEERFGIDRFNSPIFGIDPIDGTSSFARRLYEWSVSVGVLLYGDHIGGAILAPEIFGGTHIVGAKGEGVFLATNNEKNLLECHISENQPKERIIAFGPDIFWNKAYSEFVVSVSKQIRTSLGAGSSALGLALIAMGRLDGLVEPVQCPWDWFAGYPIVEEAGGKVIFYHCRNGKPERLQKPDPESYDVIHRNTAFIAGTPDCAEWLFETLEKNWQN